jgi:hypothetical protein
VSSETHKKGCEPRETTARSLEIGFKSLAALSVHAEVRLEHAMHEFSCLKITAVSISPQRENNCPMVSYDPESEADGRYVVAFVESAGEVSPVFQRKVNDIFEKHLPHVDPEAWYRTEDVVLAFTEVRDEIGSKTMEQGGAEAAKAIPWPDSVSTLSEALGVLIEQHREAYRDSTQTNPAGNYTVEEHDGRTARVGILEGFPYGPGFARGVFRQVAAEFGPEDSQPTLDEIEPDTSESHAWELTW